MKKIKQIQVKPYKKVSVSHFKSEITFGLEEGYTQKLINKYEVIGFLQKFQDNLIQKEDIYLSAKVTACEIVLSGQIEPHLSISFLNHPKYQLKLDKLKDILNHLVMELMRRFKQNRIVLMHSDETVKFESSYQIDNRIKIK